MERSIFLFLVAIFLSRKARNLINFMSLPVKCVVIVDEGGDFTF
jgi:hypothetical protein